MLAQLLTDPLQLGLAQAGVAAIAALVVIFIARQHDIHIERESIIAMLRGFFQILVLGVVLVTLFAGPDWVGAIVLILMLGFAAWTAARRVRDIPGVFRTSFIAIGLAGGSTIILMTWLGVIEYSIDSLIPVGSMILANAMNSSALALERFYSEVLSHTGEIETALALGAEPNQTLTRYFRAAVKASMIPRINTMRSLGIVVIPGLMTGMLLSGSDPVYAAVYQFVIIALILASSGLTALLSTLFIRGQFFSPAEQLVLRPDL